MDATISNSDTRNAETLVIRVNAFTHTIDDGYVMRGGRRISEIMTRAEVAAYLFANPGVRLDVQNV